MNLCAVILAAGQGTRMRSALPKVLHPLAGRPMIEYSVQSCRHATGRAPLLVVGPDAQAVRQALSDDIEYVAQPEPLGTGHALWQAEAALRGRCEHVLVLHADMPLWRPETLTALVQAQRASPGPLAFTTATVDTPRGFGRVLRGADGRVVAIVEEVLATPEQLAIRELNLAAYCFTAEWLWQTLPSLPPSASGEIYLTDLVAAAAAQGQRVATLEVADVDEALGINNRVHLAEAEAVLRRRINRKWMEAGVTLIDPNSTYIGPEVEIGQDTVILPNTHLWGRTHVGRDCRLGPNSLVRDTVIGDDCRVECSVLEGAELDGDVQVGPFAHLRPGARLGRGVHMGNFGEVKNARLGPGTRMGHFSYVGDATVGADVNIGAGTVTCNFDGVAKHHTHIDAGAFVGSDTLLIAPVHVGAGARTGAGAVVTKDVPPGRLAVGMPARVIKKVADE